MNDSPVASDNHKALQLLLFLCKHSLVDADCSCSTYLLFSDWISCLTVAWHVIASIDQVFCTPTQTEEEEEEEEEGREAPDLTGSISGG